MGRVDGYIRIDTKLDPKGMQEGMKAVTKAAVDGFKVASGAVQDFESVWETMDWEEKRDIIVQASDEIGTAWDTMTREDQLSKLKEVWNRVTNIADEAKDVKDNVEGTAEATKKWSRSMSGLQKIMTAISPRTGRYFRGARGAGEMGKILGVVLGVGVQVVAVIGLISVALLALIAIMAAAVIGIFAGIWAWTRNVTDSLFQNLAVTSAFRDRVTELKTSFDNVKNSLQAMAGTLLMALAPVLLKILDYLVKIVNFATKMIAALTGQSSYMRYIAGSATEANKQTGGIAKNMKDSAKASKATQKASEGALAAWDELNVLQQDKAQAEQVTPLMPGAGMGGMAGGMMMQKVQIEEDFLANVWLKILEIWENIIIPIWNAIWAGMWEELLLAFVFIGAFLLTAFLEVLGFLWKGVVAFLQLMAIGFIVLAQKIWARMLWVVGKIKEIWAVVWPWFLENVVNPIKEGFMIVFGENGVIAEALGLAWEGIKETAKSAVNGIIGFLNSMIKAIVSGINTIITALNKFKVSVPAIPGITKGFNIGFSLDKLKATEIPTLASGAVIPPNAPFAAILGDQRSGKNIEAPESTLRQIFQEELGDIQGEFTINFEGTLAALVRELKPYIDKENVRIGSSLVKRSTA